MSNAEYAKRFTDFLARGDIREALDETARRLENAPPERIAETEAAAARALEHLYHHLAVAPAHAFLDAAAEALPPESAARLAGAIRPRLERTQAWRRTLSEMARERMAREMRSMVRGRRLKDAARLAAAMGAKAAGEEEKRALAGLLANALGSLDHDQDKAEAICRAIAASPASYGFDDRLASRLNQERQRVFASLSSAGLDGRERAFAQVRQQAIVDLRNIMPLELAVGEPSEEETARVFEELHAMFRAVVMEGRMDALIDVTELLVEITPRDPRAVGPAVQGEERLFLSLNPRQKLCAVRALRRLAEIPRIPPAYLKFAESAQAEGYRIPIIEVMGGMGCPIFYEYILRAWQDRKLADPRFSRIDALGRLENEAATTLLLRRYTELVESRPFDPPKRREAEALSAALARIARARGVALERRGAITAAIAKATPKDDTLLGMRVALDFFSYRPADLNEMLIGWAMGRIAQGLWSQDMRPEFGRAAQGAEAELGFRHGMVELARQIGMRGLAPFLRALEPRMERFTGAYYAVAEILAEIGDESALPVLRKMTFAAWMADDAKDSKYFQETYYDTAEGSNKALTRDKIIHALLYAIAKACGIAGQAFLVETANRVRAGQLQSPGNQTASFLMEQWMAHGSEVAQFHESEAAKAPRDDADNPFAGAPPEELIKALRAKYLLANSRRAKKVLAIQEIARRRVSEAIEVLAVQLAERDSIVRSAAETALLEFGAPGIAEPIQRRLAEALIERLGWKEDADRRAARRVLSQLDPAREPFLALLKRSFEIEPSGAIKAEVSRLLIEAEARLRGDIQSRPPGAAEPPGFETVEQALPSSDEKTGDEPPPGVPLSEMDKKRLYFLARQAWIASGKNGNPPEPPK